MPLSIWLSALAIAASVPLAWWAMAGTPLPARVRSNLNSGLHRVGDLRDVALQASTHDRVVAPVVSGLARQVRRVTPAGQLQALERRMHLSGMSDRYTIEQALAAKVVTASVGAVLGTALLIGSPSFARFFLLLLFAVAFFHIPDLLLRMRADERQAEIERALADALDQITVCVEAGLSFEAAMARVASQRGPIANEFGRTLQDIQIGIPRSQALENLLGRTDVPDLRQFVHAFMHAEKYGIPVAQVLRIQSGELREKRRQRAEARALKIPVKLVFPVVLCIFPALFIVLAGPAAMRISEIF